MKLVRTLAAGAALSLFTLTPGPARAAEPSVRTAARQGLGTYLVDGRGMSLYTFKKDTPGKSACAGDCLAKWPAFHAGAEPPAAGLKPEDFTTIVREDGASQTCFRGMPLYYFAADKAAGEVNGDGVKGVWKVAAP